MTLRPLHGGKRGHETRHCPPRGDSGQQGVHHSFDDPAIVEGTDEKRLGAFRTVWDELRAYLKDFPKNY